MNVWKAFWHCRHGHHFMMNQHDTNTMNCSGCGLRVTNEILEEIANGYRQDHKDTGSPPGTVPVGAPGERPGGTIPPAQAITPSTCPKPVDQEILGWRGWTWLLEPDAFGGWNLALQGFHGKTWDGPTMIADRLPEPSNENGIYARPMDWYQKMLSGRYLLNGSNPSPVQGSVALSGRVIQGEHGWRAERGTIRELWVIGPAPVPELFVRHALEDRYKCDIHWGEIPDKIFAAWLFA